MYEARVLPLLMTLPRCAVPSPSSESSARGMSFWSGHWPWSALPCWYAFGVLWGLYPTPWGDQILSHYFSAALLKIFDHRWRA
jgi:hypothetical protein